MKPTTKKTWETSQKLSFKEFPKNAEIHQK